MRRAKPGREEVGRRLDEALDQLDVSGKELADRSGIDETTISRIRRGDPKAGETRSTTKRRIEKALFLPEGYLDGDVTLDLLEHRRHLRQRWALTLVREGDAPGYGANGIPTPPATIEGPSAVEGWLWREPGEAEQLFRTLLRNLERTTRAMVGNPDLFSAEGLRLNRLAAIDAAELSHRLGGRAIPQWLYAIKNEVITGGFR